MEKRFPPRSYLFVPGDRPHYLAKAGIRGADALILDLEDAVPPSRKSLGRREVASWLGSFESSPHVWVRINRGTEQIPDIKALRGFSFAGLVLPKVQSAGEIEAALDLLEGSDRKTIVIVETARALRAVDAIASVRDVYQLMLGEADLGAELALEPGHPAWHSMRVEVVTASVAAEINAPITPVNPDFTDPVALEDETRYFRQTGYISRPAIHPSQIDSIHRGLRPTEAEVDDARRLLAAHAAALSEEVGSHVHDGTMVDEAFVRRARHVIALWERN